MTESIALHNHHYRNLDDLLNDLRTLGGAVSVADGKLRIEAPAGVLTPELRAELAAHKEAILAHLTGDAQPTPPPTILHRIPLCLDFTPSEWLAAHGLRVVGGTPYFGGEHRPVLYVTDIAPAEVAA